MKQINLFFKTMLILCALVWSGTSVWAADSFTITFATGSGDGTSASTSTSCGTIVSEGAPYLSGNLATATKVYYRGSSGLKIGTSSAAGIIKMNLVSSVTPTSIVVNAKLYNSSKSATLKVNGSESQSIGSDFGDLTFSFSDTEISYLELESSKYCWISSITVNYASSSEEVTSVDIDASEITNTDIANGTAAGSLSAVVKDASSNTINGATVTWSSSKPSVATINEATGVVTLVKKGTTTLKATYAGVDGKYQSSNSTYELTVTNSDASGSSAHPFTPTEARNALDAGDEIDSDEDYYVRGYITKIEGLSGGTLTYFLTTDGNMTNSIKCYKGKNINGEDFTDANVLEIGDIATVKGKLSIYNKNYQLNENNEVVLIEPRTKVNIASFTATTPDLYLGALETTATTVTNDQTGWTPVAYTYSSDNTAVATVDENGVITAVAKGTANITVVANVAALDATYKVGDSKSIEITVHNPSYTAYFVVNGNADKCSVEEGDLIPFPADPADINGKKFVGWTKTAIDGTTNTAPEFIDKAKEAMGTGETEYYAVFAGTSQIPGWKKLAPSEISKEGVYALITPDGHAFNGNISSGHGQATTDAYDFVNDLAETAPDGTCEITLVAVDGGYKMYNEDHDGYLYATKAGSGGLAWGSTDNNYWLYDSDNWKYNKSYSNKYAFLRTYSNSSSNSSFRTYANNSGDDLLFAQKTTITGYSDYCTRVPEHITISAAGLATFASDEDLDFTNVENIQAYVAKDNGSKTTLEKVNKVPAGTGVLLRALNDATSFDVPVTTTATEITGNLFVRGTGAAVASIDGDYTNYVLGKKNGVVGFFKAGGKKVEKNQAYLHLNTTQTAPNLTFDDLTGIAVINEDLPAVNNGTFDLQGRRVAEPAKGFYIKNGKKVVK